MVRGEEEGSEETTTHLPNLLYAGVTNTVKQRNKQEQEKSPDQSVILYHMGRENNRMALMRSHAQHAQSSFYHMGREDNRTALMRSRTQQCTVILLSHGKREQ